MTISIQSNDISAFSLAKLINKILNLDIPISSIQNNRDYFSFDSDKGTVVCSYINISDIYHTEINDERCAYTTAWITKESQNQITNLGYKVSNTMDYAIFSVLHEFGHYLHWKNTNKEIFEIQKEDYIFQLNELKRDAQKRADRGMNQEKVYELFANSYRSLDLEKEADDFARTMIGYVIQSLGNYND